MPPLLLALETSSPVCGVAVFDLNSDQLLAQAELHVERSHASHLLPLAEQLLGLSGFGLADVVAVALSAGPGSYTGLRIGAASAKGLCVALKVPLLAVSTLELLARQAAAGVPAADSYRYCSLIDARRAEVFAGTFDARGVALSAAAPAILTPEWLAQTLATGPTIFVGSGAAKCRDLLGAPAGAVYLPRIVVPSVGVLAAVGGHKFREKLFEDIAYFEPFYLKDAHITAPRAPAPVLPAEVVNR